MTNLPANIVWRKTKNDSLPNLYLLVNNGNAVGFIYKPRDTRTDKNMWRLHTGVGEHTTFLGHECNKTVAMRQVEKQLGVTTKA